MPPGPNLQPGHVGAEVPYAQWNAYPTSHEAPADYPMQAGPELSPDSNSEQAFFDPSPTIPRPTSYQTPQPQQSWVPATSPQTMTQSSGWTPTPATIRPFSQAIYTPRNSQSSRRIMRIGFTAAGLCLIIGALILTLVSIMAQSLLPSDVKLSQTTQVNARNTRPATISPSPTLPTPTPVELLPGAQYITNARMASVVNEKTGQVLQYGTNFAVNQKIYMTFALNTGTQGGAVCFRWYLNNQYLKGFDYAFGVEKNLFYNSFSYARMATPGAGNVEVYWASTVACTDKLLAQRVAFTVS
jgi:hypothetical protein